MKFDDMNQLIMLLAQINLAIAEPTVSAVGNIASSVNITQPLNGFISYSIEFSSFPDFAGNKTNPNDFSNNLLDNLGALAGVKPYIRVGGNTQDFAIWNSELKIALNGTYNLSRSADYPTTIEIGPAYFESYNTWPGVKFSHGFNMGGNHDSRQWETLLQTAAVACKVLNGDNLYLWEYGNEPDLFAGAVRPSNWNESEYVSEWLNGTRAIKNVFKESCPELSPDQYDFLAPSFAGTSNRLNTPRTWTDGLDEDKNIKLFSSHNYISGVETLGVTLQGTLLNHTRTLLSLSQHTSENRAINPGIPYILGETNSLYHQGRPGLSNAFGAALWAVDFAVSAAATGMGRVHFHMGTDYRYAAWQPVQTAKTTVGTKAPYYGNVAVAAFLGGGIGGGEFGDDRGKVGTGVAQVQLTGEGADGETDVAYAAYEKGAVVRVLVLNLREYNYTLNGTGPGLNPEQRPVKRYRFTGLDGVARSTAEVRRLSANGSDAVTGITWDGWSYNYELERGKPVRLGNVTTGETVEVVGGAVEVAVPDSEVVVLDFGTASR
ncbi:glycoside hydrolase family 79 protein [Annulohypoxylon maeteangense]|uniref:glycoside hydrolase family 79 protein n=1 Tax=Annulohypoxylon maeteangense TaxID=1927788 RepID=UPI0020081D97|nr:glycoside hydrolase family 79 protein [Annulohypoxylon maeteangense]KAI0882169.1 glycoside hydrolase family 79 protein [Annulohypoxylon maeteangense]